MIYYRYMENFKFYVVTLLLIVGAGFLGYGAISSLRDPVYYVNNEKLTTVGDMKSENPDEASVADTATSTETAPVVATQEPTAPAAVVETPKTETPPATTKNADLIARLNKISGTLKKGSSGDSVKAVQEALNIVAKAGLPTSGTGYGTFGAGTEVAVKKFQTSAKISPATGQVASKTIAALVAKLK